MSAPPKETAPADANRAPAVRLLPTIALLLLGAGLVGFFGPQHRVKKVQIYFCWAPDCRSSASTSVQECRGLQRLSKRPFPDVLNLLVLVALAGLQLQVRVRRQRMGAVVSGIATLLGASVVLVVVAYHAVFVHLLDSTLTQWGELTTALAGLGLWVVGLLQLVLAIVQRPQQLGQTRSA